MPSNKALKSHTSIAFIGIGTLLMISKIKDRPVLHQSRLFDLVRLALGVSRILRTRLTMKDTESEPLPLHIVVIPEQYDQRKKKERDCHISP